MSKPWTVKEINILRDEYSTGVSIDIVAKKLNRTNGAIYAKGMKLGIKHLTYLKGNYPRGNIDAVIKYRYGLTPKDWDILFTKQRGCCAICGKHQSELSRRLDVHHTIVSDEMLIWGLLCPNCNKGIGLFNHDAELLKKASKFIGGEQIE